MDRVGRGQRILVTGGSGLIGAAIVDLLAVLNADRAWGMKLILAGRSEARIARRFSWPADCCYEFRQFDLLEGPLDAECDFIIHCAGICSPKLYDERPVDTLLGVVQGTNAVLDAAWKQGARCLVLSSSEVYGVRQFDEPFGERDYAYVDLLKSRSCYASGKRAAETLCAAYARQHGSDIVILRPATSTARRSCLPTTGCRRSFRAALGQKRTLC